jgi:uncharacterized membrane protein YgcG
MKRGQRSPSNSSADSREHEEAPKRARPTADKVKEEFVERQREAAFREQHHPERVVHQLLAQRQHALAAQPAFASDMKTGALTGPRLTGLGLLKDLPAPDADAEEAFKGPPPPQLHLVKFEPLPAPAVALARAVLCAAAAGPKQTAAPHGKGAKGGAAAKEAKAAAAEPPSDDAPSNGAAEGGGEDSGEGGEAAPQPPPAPARKPSNLVALLCAEPINGRTRMWAAYATRAAAEAGMRAVNSLPQMSELLDAPPAQRDAIMPSKELRASPPTEDEKQQLLARCDELLAALEARIGLPGHSAALFAADDAAAAPGGALGLDEKLELRLLYLRRLHYVDVLGGGPFTTHTALLTACGEAHLPAACIVHAAQRDGPLAAPVRYGGAMATIDAHLAYLSALAKLDGEFADKAAAELEAFYSANCVEEEPGKYRCPLSGKLFKDTIFVRKHIDNKHGHIVLDAKRASIEPKYEQYFLAGTARLAAMPPPVPPPPRFARPDDGGKGGGKGHGKGYGKGFEGGRGFGGGRGNGDWGFGKGGGKGYGKGFGKGAHHDGPPVGRGGGGGLPPPPEGAEVVKRAVVTYRDLDAPDDDELFS